MHSYLAQIYAFKFVNKIERIKNNEIKDSLIKSTGLNTLYTSNIWLIVISEN